MTELIAPFPYFGGKTFVAPEVWKRFGAVPNYVEPFFGSGAVLLGRPQPDGTETINDADGMVANFWRAVRADPQAVAEYADNPVFENDLHARHIWLVNRKESLQARLEGDSDFYDAQAAGWWCWGMSCSIGGGFCSGKGPWQAVDGKLVRVGAGRGVKRTVVHLSDTGKGVNKSSAVGGVLEWMEALAERFRRVRVCCGDWTRVCGGARGDALTPLFAGGGLCAVFLDPPYSLEAGRDMGCYTHDCGEVAHAAREWAIAHGSDKRLRIALCGYEGEHTMPAGWTIYQWKGLGGYAKLGNGETRGKENAHRERIWFSPHCLAPQRDVQGELAM